MQEGPQVIAVETTGQQRQVQRGSRWERHLALDLQGLAQGGELPLLPVVPAQAAVDLPQHAQFTQAGQGVLRHVLGQDQVELVVDALAADAV